MGCTESKEQPRAAGQRPAPPKDAPVGGDGWGPAQKPPEPAGTPLMAPAEQTSPPRMKVLVCSAEACSDAGLTAASRGTPATNPHHQRARSQPPARLTGSDAATPSPGSPATDAKSDIPARPPPPPVPKTIGSMFEVQKLLGKGSWATVYKCMHNETGEQHAVKVFSKVRLSERSLARSGRREAKLLQTLREERYHPHISNFIAEFEDPQWYHVIVELGGRDLQQVVQDRPFREKKACLYFQQLLDGIDYAHRHGVVHRDIKPANLLVDEARATLLITDFGLGSQLPRADAARYYTDLHPIKEICGTPDFMAPEVFQREHRYNLPKTDTWSCGVSLYAMLFGKPPWQEKRSRAREAEVRKGLFRNAKNGDRLARLSQHCNKVLDWMLTVDASERPKPAEVLAHEWISGEAASAYKVSESPTGGVAMRRKMSRALSSHTESSTEMEAGQLDVIPAKLCLKVLDSVKGSSSAATGHTATTCLSMSPAREVPPTGEQQASAAAADMAKFDEPGAAVGESQLPSPKGKAASPRAMRPARVGGGKRVPTPRRPSLPPATPVAGQQTNSLTPTRRNSGLGFSEGLTSNMSAVSSMPNSRFFNYALQWSTGAPSFCTSSPTNGTQQRPRWGNRRRSSVVSLAAGAPQPPSHIFPRVSTSFPHEDASGMSAMTPHAKSPQSLAGTRFSPRQRRRNTVVGTVSVANSPRGLLPPRTTKRMSFDVTSPLATDSCSTNQGSPLLNPNANASFKQTSPSCAVRRTSPNRNKDRNSPTGSPPFQNAIRRRSSEPLNMHPSLSNQLRRRSSDPLHPSRTSTGLATLARQRTRSPDRMKRIPSIEESPHIHRVPSERVKGTRRMSGKDFSRVARPVAATGPATTDATQQANA